MKRRVSGHVFTGRRGTPPDVHIILTVYDGVAIPKEHSIFRITVPLPRVEASEDDGDAANGKELVFEIHGSQFQNRPIDRTTKKFKWKNIDYI